MKKLIALAVSLMLICGAAAAKDAEPALDFQSLTGLDEIARRLDGGVSIDKIYYTDGYGFSTSEFTTEDPEEIQSLWQALNGITVRNRVDESITDWYPQIVFYFSDGTNAHVTFESHWLSLPTPRLQANYELENDGPFWNLTASLVEKYGNAEAKEDQEEKEEDNSWILPESIEMTEEVTAIFDRALSRLMGVNYEPLGYLGEKDGTYCILCRATVVYPGAKPGYSLVYVNETGVQNIWEIWMDRHAEP